MKALVLAVAGLALLVTGVVALALPVSVDDGLVSMDCGSAFTGVAEKAGLVDAARGNTTSNLAGACEDKIALRRVWGWPVAVIGLALVGGAVVSRRRAT